LRADAMRTFPTFGLELSPYHRRAAHRPCRVGTDRTRAGRVVRHCWQVIDIQRFSSAPPELHKKAASQDRARRNKAFAASAAAFPQSYPQLRWIPGRATKNQPLSSLPGSSVRGPVGASTGAIVAASPVGRRIGRRRIGSTGIDLSPQMRLRRAPSAGLSGGSGLRRKSLFYINKSE
jgi:hypothetical protein